MKSTGMRTPPPPGPVALLRAPGLGPLLVLVQKTHPPHLGPAGTRPAGNIAKIFFVLKKTAIVGSYEEHQTNHDMKTKTR